MAKSSQPLKVYIGRCPGLTISSKLHTQKRMKINRKKHLLGPSELDKYPVPVVLDI
jgi:hypothetical protein